MPSTSTLGRGKFFGEWPKNTKGFEHNENPTNQQTIIKADESQNSNNISLRFNSSKPKRRPFSTPFMRIPEEHENEVINQRVEIRTTKSRQRSLCQISKQPSTAADECDPLKTTGGEKFRKYFKNLILFWPKLALYLTMVTLRYLLFLPLSIAAPSFWLSALLWIFWKVVRFPISFLKWMLTSMGSFIYSSDKSQTSSLKRTVLISCGSTIQTLYLARNFYSAGARVIVFEFEGFFGLARFSMAVDKFYIVPKPTANDTDNYIAALCHIVHKEKASCYIPVCATSPAYYDALAKPHLELLGCATFIPTLKETIVLDDTLKVFQKCESHRLQLPQYEVLSSKSQLDHLYENGFVGSYRNIMMAVGMHGLLERYKYIVPNNRRDLKFSHEISEKQQWLIIRDVPGDHYVTCTTIKDSRVIANVSCIVDDETKNLVPAISEDNGGVDQAIQKWIKEFFAKTRTQRSVNGHLSFRLAKCQSTGQYIPLGVRVGVSLPYICCNPSNARLVCKPKNCVHMKISGNLASQDNSAISFRRLKFSIPSGNSNPSPALDKREALFAYWDPLPYCAYYHFQLPLESVKVFLQKRQQLNKSISPQITLTVH